MAHLVRIVWAMAAIAATPAACGRAPATQAAPSLADGEVDNLIRGSYHYVAMYNVITRR